MIGDGPRGEGGLAITRPGFAGRKVSCGASDSGAGQEARTSVAAAAIAMTVRMMGAIALPRVSGWA